MCIYIISCVYCHDHQPIKNNNHFVQPFIRSNYLYCGSILVYFTLAYAYTLYRWHRTVNVIINKLPDLDFDEMGRIRLRGTIDPASIDARSQQDTGCVGSSREPGNTFERPAGILNRATSFG